MHPAAHMHGPALLCNQHHCCDVRGSASVRSRIGCVMRWYAPQEHGTAWEHPAEVYAGTVSSTQGCLWRRLKEQQSVMAHASNRGYAAPVLPVYKVSTWVSERACPFGVSSAPGTSRLVYHACAACTRADAHLRPQPRDVEVAHVGAVQEDGAGVDVVEALDEAHRGDGAADTLADEGRDVFAGRNKREATQHRTRGACRVRQGDVSELHLALHLPWRPEAAGAARVNLGPPVNDCRWCRPGSQRESCVCAARRHRQIAGPYLLLAFANTDAGAARGNL